jgi:hypothetical protein
MEKKPSLKPFHTDFAAFQEQYVRHYIALADTKAAVVFGVCSSLIAFSLSNPLVGIARGNGSLSFDTFLAWGSLAFFGLGAAAAGWVVLPRIANVGEGLIFFGAVRSYRDGTAYRDAVEGSSEQDLTSARLQHCYNVSKICWKKYKFLRAAMWFTYIAGGLLILLLAQVGF